MAVARAKVIVGFLRAFIMAVVTGWGQDTRHRAANRNVRIDWAGMGRNATGPNQVFHSPWVFGGVAFSKKLSVNMCLFGWRVGYGHFHVFEGPYMQCGAPPVWGWFKNAPFPWLHVQEQASSLSTNFASWGSQKAKKGGVVTMWTLWHFPRLRANSLAARPQYTRARAFVFVRHIRVGLCVCVG